MKMKKKYGLWTATAMVVGIVIGSGIFFKTSDILKISGNNPLIGLLAWIIGAIAMIFGAQVFGYFAQKIEKTNGIVDYAEYAFGKKVGYLVGWFKSYVYFPCLVSVLGWVSAWFTLQMLGFDSGPAMNLPGTWILTIVYMLLFYAINYFAPIFSGKFQVSTTIIKLTPIIIIGTIATIIGLVNGTAQANYEQTQQFITTPNLKLIAGATVATAFAYEGWIISATINHEINDSKKNLPKALFMGTAVIAIISVLFYLGMTAYSSDVVNISQNEIQIVASNIFGHKAFGTIIMGFVVVSCLGTLNGLVLGSIRSPYSLAVRGNGILPEKLVVLDKKTMMPRNSAIAALCISLVFLVVHFGNFQGWYNRITPEGAGFETSEIPIAFMYFAYVAIYIYAIVKFKEQNTLQRFIIPVLAILGGMFIIFGAFTKDNVWPGLIFSVAFTAIGLLFYREKPKKEID